jgi:RimJ/RimL family protein N-acetyltransferase
VERITPPILEGRHVRLEPLEARHAAGLFAVGRDASIWEWLALNPFVTQDDTARYIDEALATASGGAEIPFAVIERASGAVAGTTRYLEIRPLDRALEIGWTWYGVPYQRTALNTEAKLLLLTHAFDVWGAQRVQFKTDAKNLRSRRAIERLGAKPEGILRRHSIVRKNGNRRDSAYYSIILEEWEGARARLQALLPNE